MQLKLTFVTALMVTAAFGATLTDSRLLDAVKSENLAAVKAALAKGASVCHRSAAICTL